MRLSRSHAQHGFTMPLVLGVMLVATLLGAGALAAARGGTAPSGETRDSKQAYAAAEAGLNWYQSRLIYDNAYWAKCETPAGDAAPVNQRWTPASDTEADPRRWRTIGTTRAEYTVELLPATGKPACSTSDPTGSMIEPGLGTFRIRATGRFNGNKRSIVATFRRARFLDFLYLTTFETTDPDNYLTPSARTFAADNCDDVRSKRNASCSEIQFAAGDAINGPLHSEDSLLICGAAKFGRTSSDAIETVAAPPPPGYYSPSGCSGSPNFVAKLKTGAGQVSMPSAVDIDELRTTALPNYQLSGTNYLTLNDPANKITIKRMTGATTSQTSVVDWPSNGLIQVAEGSSGCTPSAPSAVTYTGASAESYGCANVYVHGSYSKDLTIASKKDVIVDGSVTKASGSDAVAGLIALRFVRVYHPVSSLPASDGSCSGSSNQTGSLSNPVIEAAILATTHSFTVDNYRCGAPLGTLAVTGGIAQEFRGAVGTGAAGSSTPSTGYLKNYAYDDRLTYRNPPFFLDPENATWRVLRSNEQAPAR